MSKMFKTITRTWNPFTGCLFECSYCWARKLAETKLKNSPKYVNGFEPTFHPQELKHKFEPGGFVFVSDMGDIRWATWKDMQNILAKIEHYPDTRFLLQTKDPSLFIASPHWPGNVYLGTTIESNRDWERTKAPKSCIRHIDMLSIVHPHKFISIEPIMDFDLDVLVQWVADIAPEIIEVGADNYRNNLPEPSWGKVEVLLARLREICPKVVEKEGLERLRREANR